MHEGLPEQLIEQLNEAIKTHARSSARLRGYSWRAKQSPRMKLFQMLVTASQNSHLKLREVAQSIVGDAAEL